MSDTEPSEGGGAPATRPERHLERAPGERYTPAGSTLPGLGQAGERDRGSALALPITKAAVVWVVGAVLLFALGALFAQTAGLLFVAGLTGAAIGLLVARTRVSSGDDPPALTGRQATWLAIGLSVAAVVVGALGTWLFARGEGGTLGLVDYLLETFGPLVPAEILIAMAAAAWGVGAGPVER